MSFTDLPTLNACLNSTCFILISTGYYFLKKGRIDLHKRCMIGAVLISVLFFASYIVYHSQVGSVKFTGQGTIRVVYFTILISHTILATMIPFLVGITVWRGLADKIDKHRKIAKWTWPIWMYVSFTGVIIYLMLYQLPQG